MTNSEKKAWLGQYRANEREIDRLTEEIQRWASRSTQMAANLDGMPKSGGSGDRIQLSVEKIAELQDRLCQSVDKCVRLRHEIENVINTVQDGTLISLLKLRYIEGYTWEKVAVEMHYSYMHVCRLHGYALDKIKML